MLRHATEDLLLGDIRAEIDEYREQMRTERERNGKSITDDHNGILDVYKSGDLQKLLESVSSFANLNITIPPLGGRPMKATVAAKDSGGKKKKTGKKRIAKKEILSVEKVCDENAPLRSTRLAKAKKTKPSLQVPTRTTRQTRSTRSRNTTAISPVIHKAKSKKPAPAFKRLALQELDTNTPTSSGTLQRKVSSTAIANPIISSRARDPSLMSNSSKRVTRATKMKSEKPDISHESRLRPRLRKTQPQPKNFKKAAQTAETESSEIAESLSQSPPVPTPNVADVLLEDTESASSSDYHAENDADYKIQLGNESDGDESDQMEEEAPAPVIETESSPAPTKVAEPKSQEEPNDLSSKSPAYNVDETGNVTDTALERLFALSGLDPSVKPVPAPAVPKPMAQKKKSILKRPPIAHASRQTVSKTPGVNMPLATANSTIPVTQAFGDIASSLFPKPTPSKALAAIEPLFPKSIFSAPSPRRLALASSQAKKISFAPSTRNKETETSLSKKRGASSIAQPTTPLSMVKRSRSANASMLEGKSSLRERIESIRKSKVSGGFSQTPAVHTPSNLAFNYAPTHFNPIKSPVSRSQTSTGVRFTKLEGLGEFCPAKKAEKEKENVPNKERKDREAGTEKDIDMRSSSAAASSAKTALSFAASDLSKVTQTPGSAEAEASSRDNNSKISLDDKKQSEPLELSPEIRIHRSSGISSRKPTVDEVVDITTDTPERLSIQPTGTVKPNSEAVQVIDSLSSGPSIVPSNLMTSFKSFLPSSAASFLGFKTDDAKVEEETEQMRTARVAGEVRLDAERREAEMVARREAQRVARQAEAVEKQRRAEANRKALALAEQRREQERKRKEVERMRKLRADIDARKAKKAEEERKREQRRQRVLEHKRRVEQAEEKRRAEIAAKELAERRRQQAAAAAASGRKGHAGGAGPSGARAGAMPPPTGRVPNTPGTNRALFLGKKKPEEFTSYEMSAEKRFNPDDDDDTNGKPIPDWARHANVSRVHNTQTEDPDKVFKHVTTVDLEQVFASTKVVKKRYRTRHSSGQWTRDRLTAKEEMEYKRNAGFI